MCTIKEFYTELMETKFHGYSSFTDAVDTTTSYIMGAFEKACHLHSVITRRISWWNSYLARLRKQCRSMGKARISTRKGQPTLKLFLVSFIIWLTVYIKLKHET